MMYTVITRALDDSLVTVTRRSNSRQSAALGLSRRLPSGPSGGQAVGVKSKFPSLQETQGDSTCRLEMPDPVAIVGTHPSQSSAPQVKPCGETVNSLMSLIGYMTENRLDVVVRLAGNLGPLAGRDR